jgi:vacuolar-type H+-ATPase subunit H
MENTQPERNEKKKRKPSEAAVSALKEINAIAKKLKDENPNSPWKELIKEASRIYRSGRKEISS